MALRTPQPSRSTLPKPKNHQGWLIVSTSCQLHRLIWAHLGSSGWMRTYRPHYARLETAILGLVVRVAVGRTIAQYLSEKIRQPALKPTHCGHRWHRSGSDFCYFSAVLRTTPGLAGCSRTTGHGRDAAQFATVGPRGDHGAFRRRLLRSAYHHAVL
jgi:hypothetical protein